MPVSSVIFFNFWVSILRIIIVRLVRSGTLEVKKSAPKNSFYLCYFPFFLLSSSLLCCFSSDLISNISKTNFQEIKLKNLGNEFSLNLGCYFISLGAGKRQKDGKKKKKQEEAAIMNYEEARMRYHRHWDLSDSCSSWSSSSFD